MLIPDSPLDDNMGPSGSWRVGMMRCAVLTDVKLTRTAYRDWRTKDAGVQYCSRPSGVRGGKDRRRFSRWLESPCTKRPLAAPSAYGWNLQRCTTDCILVDISRAAAHQLVTAYRLLDKHAHARKGAAVVAKRSRQRRSPPTLDE